MGELTHDSKKEIFCRSDHKARKNQMQSVIKPKVVFQTSATNPATIAGNISVESALIQCRKIAEYPFVRRYAEW